MKTILFQQNQIDLKATNTKKTISNESIIDLEHVIKSSLNSVCRITTSNTIKFCNSDFIRTSGFNEKELLNKSFNLVKHPEMPEIISDYINYHIKNGKEFTSILKNKTKEGKYFWTLSNFNPNKGSNYNIAYTLTSKEIPIKAKKNIKKLYHCLHTLEIKTNKKTAYKYLIGFLEEHCMSFSEYTNYLASLK